MPVVDLMMEGVKLMFLGMGIVFAFLAILVMAMNGMSRLAKAIEPEAFSAPTGATAQPATALAGAGSDKALIAAISAAVTMYRSKNQ